jgi:hypothetical protein
MFYGFAEVADWRAFQHFDQILKSLENRRCNTSALAPHLEIREFCLFRLKAPIIAVQATNPKRLIP